MAETFEYTSQGRSTRAIVILVLVYSGLLAMLILLDASFWLIGLLALTTLPALYDIYANPSAGLILDRAELQWHSGGRRGSVSLSEISHMRFDTRLDFSVRVSAVLESAKRIRLPYEALPPHKDLEAAFQTRGIRVERHHFSLLG